MAKLQLQYPDWPELSQPIAKFLQVWEYGQIRKRYAEDKDNLVFSEQPLIMAGGASFVEEAHFSGVAKSAEALADNVTQLLNC